MDKGIGPGVHAGFGRHLDLALAVLAKGDIERVDDVGHRQCDGFDVGAGEVEKLRCGHGRDLGIVNGELSIVNG